MTFSTSLAAAYEAHGWPPFSADVSLYCSDLRNGLSKKLYGIRYAELPEEQRTRIKELCPQRVSEQYNETSAEKGGQP